MPKPFYEEKTWTLDDDFLYRFGGKGFSDQQGIPQEVHERIFAETLAEMKAGWGEDFESIEGTFITEGITLHVYEK